MGFNMFAVGRLAAQPELQLRGQNQTPYTEIRVLDSRWDYKQKKEVTEAATFFAYGEDAQRLCEQAVKGQQIECTGFQETSHYDPPGGGDRRTYVKFRLTHFTLGYKPRVSDAPQDNLRTNRQYDQNSQPADRHQAPQQAPRQAPAPQPPRDDADNWIDS